MFVRIKRNWVFLTGIKFTRHNLIVDSDKFVQFWALASGIFPNTSIIVSKLRILVLFTVRDRNLERLQSESIILYEKLNNLVVSVLSGQTGLKLDKPSVEDFSFIRENPINSNQQKLNENPISNILISENDLNPTLLNVRKILPRAILQDNGYYKIMIMFENLKFNANLRNTFIALTQFGTRIIIGSRQYGKFKSVLLEIIDKNYNIVSKRYHDLINICNQSNQFSGKLSLVDNKLLEKNLFEYSLGLAATSDISSNFIDIITKLPELLSIKK
ncbi:MAG: hypothetical protein GPJ54_12840 [Candidatus Heimdallarchaeota archaeon]|nr:hypothetical protein [Candidatus Heimdallarchaeota archaeon]